MLPAASELPQATLVLHCNVYECITHDHNLGRPSRRQSPTTVDAPAASGLGSSSALVIALVDAFRAFLVVPLGQYEQARLAFDIERLDLGLPGGRQDQHSAAFGGSSR